MCLRITHLDLAKINIHAKSISGTIQKEVNPREKNLFGGFLLPGTWNNFKMKSLVFVMGITVFACNFAADNPCDPANEHKGQCERQGIIVENAPSSIVEGQSHMLSIKLNQAVIESLSVTITSNTSAVTIDGSSQSVLTFNKENSTIAQTVTLGAVSDTNFQNEQGTITLRAPQLAQQQFNVISQDSLILDFDISATQGANAVFGNIEAAIDLTNSKLLAVSNNQSQASKPWLFRCDADGSNCSDHDLSATQGANSGAGPSFVVDGSNNKLLIVTVNISQSNKPWLYRCDLDGTNCTDHDISASQGNNSAANIAIGIDSANNKLLVVTNNTSQSSKPWLFRCDLDGSNCTDHDISATQGNNSVTIASLAIDSANSKLLVTTTTGVGSGPLWLYRCNLDGSSCTDHNISGGLFGSHSKNGLIIDTTNNKLLALNSYLAPNGSVVHRCDLDGTNCTNQTVFFWSKPF